MGLTNVNNAAPSRSRPLTQPPTAGTIEAISVMNVVLLVGNHILYDAAPSPHIQALSYECFGFITVLPFIPTRSLSPSLVLASSPPNSYTLPFRSVLI